MSQLLNQIKGALFGFAIGDALGGTTEFMSVEEIQQEYGFLKEIIGGGVWGLEPGETTDDTTMTLAVAKGIFVNPDDPIEAIGEEFLKWRDSGPKDIGVTIRTVFNLFEGNWFQAARRADQILHGKTAGNGALMRSLPIGLVYQNIDKMNLITQHQARMTHFSDLSTEICMIYNHIAYQLMKGENLSQALRNVLVGTEFEPYLTQRPNVLPTGFVVNTFQWVVHLLATSVDFEQVVQAAANMGEDSDTVAAIAGGLSGLHFGFDQLPSRYVDALLCKHELHTVSEKLFYLRTKQMEALQ